MTEKEPEKGTFLEDLKRMRELADSLISRIESGETDDKLRQELDEARGVITKITGWIGGIQFGEIFDQLKTQSEAAQKKIRDICSDAIESTKSAASNIPGEVDKLYKDLFGEKKEPMRQEEMRAKILSPDFISRYYAELRKRNWDDKGIEESLEALLLVLASK